MKKIVECKPLESYRVWLRFNDGVEDEADFSDHAGKGIFAPWVDYAEFKKAHVDDWGALVFSEQIDFCPDALYLEVSGMLPEELFPSLRGRVAHA